jgi:hypothetical protein
MRIRTKAIVLNLAIALTLLVESRFYPSRVIVLSGAILFPVANVALAVKAWKKHRAAAAARGPSACART